MLVRVSGTPPSFTWTWSGLPAKTMRVEALDRPEMRSLWVWAALPERTVTGTSAAAYPSLRTSTATSHPAGRPARDSSWLGVTAAMVRYGSPRSRYRSEEHTTELQSP